MPFEWIGRKGQGEGEGIERVRPIYSYRVQTEPNRRLTDRRPFKGEGAMKGAISSRDLARLN